VSHRPLVFVSGLALGDYLLWSWSLNGNHTVLALVSGLTLPPLVVAWLWFLAVSLARLIAGAARRRPAGQLRQPHARKTRRRRRLASATAAAQPAAGSPAPSDAPSHKLAA
jgi:hypothetical protein